MIASNSELYEKVNKLSDDLGQRNFHSQCARLRNALRSGCTSGEILSDLYVELKQLKKDGCFSNYNTVVDEIIFELKKAI